MSDAPPIDAPETLSPAVPAATLVLMHEPGGGAPPDLLMIQRPAGMAFAAGAWAFPGGRVDAADIAMGGDGPLGDDTARFAALRETIEEVGIAPALSSSADAHGWQSALLAGQSLAALLTEAGLTIDRDALVPFARWAPKMNLKRRFDTLFLIARVEGPRPAPRLLGDECAAAEWISAAAMLDRIADGTAGAIFPTKRNLERLAGLTSFAAAVADAHAHGTERIVPWVEDFDGVPHVTIPADVGYPIIREPLTSAIRA